MRKPIHADGIVVHTLEGGRCVALMHQGPYAELGRSYQRVFEYIRAKQLKPKTPLREVYVKGPGMISGATRRTISRRFRCQLRTDPGQS